MSKVRRGLPAAIAAVLLAALAVSCLPREMPAFGPDGKTVALTVADLSGENRALWTYDVEAKKAARRPLPEGWELKWAQWHGGRLFVFAASGGNPGEEPRVHLAAYDLEKNAVGPDLFPDGLPRGLARTIFFGGHDGKAALFVEAAEPAEDGEGRIVFGYDVRFGPDFPAGVPLIAARAMPAGRGWSVRIEKRRDPEREGEEVLVALEAFDAEGRKAARLEAGALAPACYLYVRSPVFARVSADGTALFLAFGTDTNLRPHERRYTFGVFDLPSGSLLWHGAADGLYGSPLVTRGEVWTLEKSGAPPAPGESEERRVVLARHLRNGAAEGAPGRRTEILALDLGEEAAAGEFAPTADGKELLVSVNGRKPRLLFIPLREGVTEKDVKTVEIRE